MKNVIIQRTIKKVESLGPFSKNFKRMIFKMFFTAELGFSKLGFSELSKKSARIFSIKI
jgi:hypothetical protein